MNELVQLKNLRVYSCEYVADKAEVYRLTA
jgi:hypothetical protein